MSCCNEATSSGAGQMNKSENLTLVKASSQSGAIRWRVRQMRYEDIDRCLDIWLQVELTEARVTVANALAIDPAGLYVAVLESNGEVIGMCSGVMARPDTAFMGFYAVAPEYQGIGIGRELWARTVARLDNSIHNIGLYGVPSMSNKYKKSGFKVEDSVRMLIFESEPSEQLQSKLKCLHDLLADKQKSNDCLRIELISGEQVRNEQMIGRLIEYDQQVHGHSREKLLRNYLLEADEVPLTIALIQQRRPCGEIGCNSDQTKNDAAKQEPSCCSNGPRRVTSTTIKTCEENLSASVKSSLSISEASPQNICEATQSRSHDAKHQQERQLSNNLAIELEEHLIGYGCIRHDNTGGAMVGPLYARSSDACQIILRELIERFNMSPGGKYSVMSLTSNEQADKLLRRIGFQEMDQCSKMFTKFIPEAALDQIYYVHSPNFTLF